MRILREIHRPEMKFGRLGEYIKQEISLSYKLLRYINSAFFGLRNQITSIKQALVLLGEREIKNWISLVALAGMGDDKPEELAVQSIIRAKFCQVLAPYAGLAQKAEDLFLLGLLSMIDAFLDRPLEEVLREIPIDDEIKKALLGLASPLGKVYQFVRAYEKGDWAAGHPTAPPPRNQRGRLAPALFCVRGMGAKMLSGRISGFGVKGAKELKRRRNPRPAQRPRGIWNRII